MDYSQIELRLMAHYSQDPIMLNSFKNDEDIHKRTASEIFGTEIDEVDAEMRRRAKTINFGLLYGMSAFGLSNQLGVSRAEADIFLNNYFDRYSAVKKFMSDIVESSKDIKYVETLYGRKGAPRKYHNHNRQLKMEKGFGKLCTLHSRLPPGPTAHRIVCISPTHLLHQVCSKKKDCHKP